MASKYFLLSKTTQRFVDYEGRAIRLNKSTPYTVDEVLIAKKGRTTPCKKITTFKDSNGKITERIFKYNKGRFCGRKPWGVHIWRKKGKIRKRMPKDSSIL